MKIKRDKVILNIRETPRERRGKWGGQYPHVVENKIYYELSEPNEIHYAILNKNIASKPSNNIVIKNSMSTNNFRVFLDTSPATSDEEKYKAVGGYHTNNGHSDLSSDINYDEVDLFDPVWCNIPRKVLKDNFHHPKHANGLYVFVSSDGVNWKEYHKTPVISMLTKCVDDNYEELPLGVLGLDWMPSIFFDHNIDEYVMYLRANLSLGCRYILYSRSKNLIDWTIPRLISCDPAFDAKNKHNFYYASVYPIQNKYIAFPPFFVNKILNASGARSYHDQCTYVMISGDGLNWKTVDKILPSDQRHHMEYFHVVSFEQDDVGYTLYVHEGWGTPDNKLVKYIIEKEELDSLL